MTVSEIKKLKVGVAGLGRMGQRHALHYYNLVARAELVAVCTIMPHEMVWAKENLLNVAVYDKYDDMLNHPGIEAVVVSTSAAVHGEQILKAIAADKHCLSEKPLAHNTDECNQIITEAAKKPYLKILCGFSRRFDVSYRDAKAKVDSGLIGKPTVFKSQTGDHWLKSFYKGYAMTMGGLWMDMGIHDTDLMFWFFGHDAKIKSISSSATCVVVPELKDAGVKDNTIAIIEFYDERFACLFISSMLPAGQEDTCEIMGPEGKLTINVEPQANFVRIHDSTGIRKEVPPTYFERFREAFVTEAIEFADACLDDKPLPITLQAAARAVETVLLLQEALDSGEKIYFDRNGQRVAKPTA
ncbi:hypothetical protein BZA70DRAFT_283226 [Myxozyma melibiosi]|uniref:Uncharacterized protein n=1 Tax=Myxozyma melibiosi TaxID=54550 RepID=A0ABR1F2H2_9ASCO